LSLSCELVDKRQQYAHVASGPRNFYQTLWKCIFKSQWLPNTRLSVPPTPSVRRPKWRRKIDMV